MYTSVPVKELIYIKQLHFSPVKTDVLRLTLLPIAVDAVKNIVMGSSSI